MNRKYSIAIAALSLLCLEGNGGAWAADVVPVRAPRGATAAVSFNPNPTGFYVGLGASATVADTQFTGAFPASTFAAGAGVDLLFGYMISADPVSGQFKAIELGGTWRDATASVACDPAGPCEAQSRYGIWQRLKLGGSLASLTSLLPGGNTVFPIGGAPLPVTPTTHPYVSISVHEDFVSAMVGGIGANKIKLAPYVGVGFLQQLGPDQVSDTSLECTLPGTGMAVGLGSVKAGTTCMARQAIEF